MTSAQLSESVAELFRRRRFREAFEAGVEGLGDGEDLLSRGEAVRTRRWVGLSAVAMGRIDAAMPHLRRAYEWDPTDFDVALTLGELLFKEGRFAEGWDVLEAVLLHHRERLDAESRRELCVRLADSYLAAGNPWAAIRRLVEAREDGVDGPEVRAHLAVAYERVGEVPRAIAILRADLDDLALPDKARRAIHIHRLATDADAASELLQDVAFEIGVALDADPKKLELLELQTQLLETAQVWTGLHAAYSDMIARLDASDPALQPLLALLWRKTGDVSLTRLGLRERAATEYEHAERHTNDSVKDAPVYVPTGVFQAATPVEGLWHELLEDVRDLDRARAYAAALQDRGDTGHAASVLEVVAALAGDQQAQRAGAGGGGVREFRHPLTDELRNRFLRPRARRAALDALFHIAFHVFGPLVAADEEDLHLRDRDRLTRGSKLPVVRALRQTSAGLGFPRPPASFGDSGRGIRAAGTLAPIVFVGADRLAATDDGRLRFELGFVLTLMQPRFALRSMVGVGGLASIAEALSGISLHSSEAADPEFVEQLRAYSRASLDDRWLEPLEQAAARLAKDSAPPSLDIWLEGVETEAMRTALVCAGDVGDALAAAEAMCPEGGYHGTSREQDLLMFAMSPLCHELREALGLGS